MERLKELRIQEGLSQSELAVKTGINQTSYSSYETGRSSPTIEPLIKLADYYHVSLDYLVGRTFANDAGYLSDDEKELLDNYRKLSKDNKFTYLIEGKGMVLAQKF